MKKTKEVVLLNTEILLYGSDYFFFYRQQGIIHCIKSIITPQMLQLVIELLKLTVHYHCQYRLIRSQASFYRSHRLRDIRLRGNLFQLPHVLL